MNSNRRIIYNTLILYTRVIISFFVVFLSTRIVLEALGEDDYGLYNVVAGVVTALSFLNGALTVSTQRYLSFYKGRADRWKSKMIFFHSCFLHAIMAILIVGILFSIENYVINSVLNIHLDRISAAIFLYRSMLMAMFFTVMTVPFNAVLNANENMLVFSYFGILTNVLILVIAFSISDYSGDRLIFYGVGVALVYFVIFLLQFIFCTRKYYECQYSNSIVLNKETLKELVSYIGWNSFGAFTGMAKNQGGAILLNVFFGTRINASYGVANQLANQMNSFSTMLLKSTEPQLMKSEGAGDRDRMIQLSFVSSKVGYYLIAIFAIPSMIEIESILSIWLKEVPLQAPFFCRMILCTIMINQITIGLQSGLQSLGKIKYYMLLGGGLKVLMLPVAYLLLWKGYDYTVVMYCYVFFEFLCGVVRVYFFCYYTGTRFSLFFHKIILCQLKPTIIVGIIGFLMIHVIIEYRFLMTLPFLATIFLISIYFFGLNKEEKDYFNITTKKILSYVPLFKRV